jgi:hypothetical protein
VNIIPGLKLRASAEDEALGMDDAQIGEFANDYVEVRRDFTDWTPSPSGGKDAEGRWDSRDTPMTRVESAHTSGNGTATAGAGMAAGDRHGVPDVGPDQYERSGAGGGPARTGDPEKAARHSADSGRATAGNRHGGSND